MVRPHPNPRLDALKRILEAERKALKAGNYHQFATLIPVKEKALKAFVEGDPPHPRDLIWLQSQTKRNQSLFEATMRGMRSALRRINQVTQTERSFTTYAPDGSSATLGSKSGRDLEQRA
jgi:flagellar biosynthesis/type III secretory pathway chaperone